MGGWVIRPDAGSRGGDRMLADEVSDVSLQALVSTQLLLGEEVTRHRALSGGTLLYRPRPGRM